MNNTLISGLPITVFFIIRIILKFVFEDEIETYIYKHTSLDYTESGIIENGISLSLSFLAVGIIKEYGLHSFNISTGPYSEFISILLSTIVMLVLYEMYKRIKNKKDIYRGFNRNYIMNS